jgi:hypothetical protein
MGNQMSLEENEQVEQVEQNEQNEQVEQVAQVEQTAQTAHVNKKIKTNMQDPKGDIIKKRRSTFKSGANSNTFKKTRHNRKQKALKV